MPKRERSETEKIIRSIAQDMKLNFMCRRVSWTSKEVYLLIREIERLRVRNILDTTGGEG